jgi:hypothetical protein
MTAILPFFNHIPHFILPPGAGINTDSFKALYCKVWIPNAYGIKSRTVPHTALHNAQKPHAALCGFAHPV